MSPRRSGALSLEDANGLIEVLRSLEIVVDHEGAEQAEVLFEVRRLAGELKLSGYDAAYLELAFRKNLPLATLQILPA